VVTTRRYAERQTVFRFNFPPGLDILIRRALRNASPAEAERIRRALREGRVAEVLPELVKLAEREGPLDIYYVSEGRFEAAEEREEAVAEVEEAVAEDGLEPVEEVEEVVEDDEYVGQHIVRRAFPDPEVRPRARRPPY
jgi:hypothetical protein